MTRRALKAVFRWPATPYWFSLLGLASAVGGTVSALMNHQGWSIAAWPLCTGIWILSYMMAYRTGRASERSSAFWHGRYDEVARSMEVMRQSAKGWLLP